MSLNDLQSWLLDTGVAEDLKMLTRRTVEIEIENLDPEQHESSVKDIDWSRLLLAGSIFARSDERPYQEAALRIATSAVTISAEKRVIDAGSVLLNKLSNFRAINLAESRGLLAPELEERLGLSLRMEAQQRQMAQSVLVSSSGKWLEVNEFQRQFWTRAETSDWLSASAPTASGKTFLVLQWLIDRMRSSGAAVAIYLAPTRALVSEIEGNLKSLLTGKFDIEIASLPLHEKYTGARAGGNKLILVFTQERLHLMANLLEGMLVADVLVVDEAHKIGDSQRGVILQDAIERITRANPMAKTVFISPATQNPEELLSDAPATAITNYVDSDVPTVLQNVLVARQVPLKPKLWNLSIHSPEGTLSIGTLKLKSVPSGPRKRLAFIAAAAGENGGGTLVYANGAAEAENVADLICQLIPGADVADKELLDLADLARKGVHPNFALAPLVERGVAFHYGNMPSLLRLEIERLFRAGKIRFLVCTSTLIEGVNLSCRTIVLRGPRKGKGHPMEPHDFWNLAGRAGRWGDEFQGNIICIDAHDQNAWPIGVPARARYPIKRESDTVLDLGDGLADYLESKQISEPSTNAAETFEQVGAYLLSTFLREGTILSSTLAKRHSPDTIERLDNCLSDLAKGIEIDADTAARHPGVSAFGLQSLLDAFRAYEGDISNLVPATVESDDSYDRFVTIMRRINAHLYPAFLPDARIPLHALIVVQWLKGFSLATMIQRNIDYHRRAKRAYKLPTLIRETMESVEQTARFKAPKFLSAYADILKVFLTERDRADLMSEGLDIGTQLEFGVSSKTLLSLMELGLSRMSAVQLYEQIATDDLSKEECIAWAKARDTEFEGLNVPAIIVREIREKLISLPDSAGNSTEN